MTLGFKRGREVDSEELYFKLLIYGDSGAGKTWLASTAPDPVILLTERNGEQSVRLSNPDAPYVYVSTAEEVREFVAAALDGSWADIGLGTYKPRTLVVDGLTEVQRLVKDQIQKQRGDGEFSIRDWGVLNEKVRGLLRVFRDLPYNVVCTALSKIDVADEIRYTQPAFQGKAMGGEAMQYFNLVGYVYKRPKGGGRGQSAEIEHAVMFDGPARVQCKSCHPIRGQRTGETIADWFDELRVAGIPEGGADSAA